MSRKGLYPKYIVEKTNGKPADPDANYFVLRLDTDPHARQAIKAYASSIRSQNPELAEDLDNLIAEYE